MVYHKCEEDQEHWGKWSTAEEARDDLDWFHDCEEQVMGHIGEHCQVDAVISLTKKVEKGRFRETQ